MDPRVTIDVMSRHVRLLGEGALQGITIIPDRTAVIIDTAHNEQISARAIAAINDGGIRLTVDSKVQTIPVRMRIDGLTDGASCTVIVPGEERRYPLPMIIEQDASGLRFRITERLSRYALDSSRAEYGMAYWKEQEAIMALAHVIAARYRHSGRTHVHKDADFCDLTHCQVYRGITGKNGLEEDWMIDPASLTESMFFHSRCGGRTFDTRMFSEGASAREGVRDYLFQDGTILCRDPGSRWDRSLAKEEMLGLLFPHGGQRPRGPVSVRYDMNKRVIMVSAGERAVSYPPETFRLIINRVKGWNFIKSNNYTIQEQAEGNKAMIRFEGEGLGHGVGFCQHGAVALARRGYNRFEILEHYFPTLSLVASRSDVSVTPYLSYCIFDYSSGAVIASCPDTYFHRRTVPPGSLFKLIVSLYLAAERPDIFNEYSYTCLGKNSADENMPDRCWSHQGHGTVQVRDALTHSCNLYFASLYNRISIKNFSSFFNRFCRCTGINGKLPDLSAEKDWSRLLAGLDFRVTFSIGDYIKLVRYLKCGTPPGQTGETGDAGVPNERRLIIFEALREACVKGTAGGPTKPYGASCNYDPLPARMKKGVGDLSDGVWGKTATVVDGTNLPVSCGMFIGGAGPAGIVAVLRKSNGHMAARWARLMLMRHREDNAAGCGPDRISGR